MYESGSRMEMVEVALGIKPYDLLIRNVKIVNVYSSGVTQGNIGIKNGCIVSIQANESDNCVETFDAGGLYALPGFIDTHIHIDSTMLRPEELAALIVPHGTTAVFADPMEIANVSGIAGVEALLESQDQLPYHFFLEVPSRVPTAPGLETTGGELGLTETDLLLNRASSISLGELDPSKILGLHSDYFKKIEMAVSLGKIANGHAAGLEGKSLTAYACAGLSDDHEILTYAEAKERLALGLAILVREGSTERNLENLISGLVQHGGDSRHWMMCTDDKHPDEILREGHIDFMITKAVALGMEPISAIQMASLNAACHFRMDHLIGSLTPGRWADIVLTEKLTSITPKNVFHKGILVAERGQLINTPTPASYPERLYKTVTITSGMDPKDFAIEVNTDKAFVRVVEITPEQIVNKEIFTLLKASNGRVNADPERDVLKVAVVERYGKNGNIGIGFVKGFGLTTGALSSTIAHDHHNLIIVGADDVSMATCVLATQQMQGGLVVANGNEILAKLPLSLGGLFHTGTASEVIKDLDRLNEAARSMGCKLPAPFMTLSFVSLPTVPELGITDMGFVDVQGNRLLPTIEESASG